jgi:hypothetical protein
MGSFREQQSQERFEKRKIPRFQVQLPAELGFERADLSSICTNLSSEGVSVETACRVSVGERLSVRVMIAAQEEPLRMLGQVVWKRAMTAIDPGSNPIHEIGIRFLRPLPSPWKTPSDRDLPPEMMGEEGIPEIPPFQQP